MSIFLAYYWAACFGVLAAGVAYTLQFRRLWEGRVSDTETVRAFRAAAATLAGGRTVPPARILATTAVSSGQQAASWGGFIWVAAETPAPAAAAASIRNTLCHEREHLRRHHGTIVAGAFGVYVTGLLICAFLGSASGFILGGFAACAAFPALSRWQERQADRAIVRWGDPTAFCADLAAKPPEPPLPWPWRVLLMTHPSNASRMAAMRSAREQRAAVSQSGPRHD